MRNSGYVVEGVEMKILVNAFAFSPIRGSECAVGWNMVNELAKMHNVTVLFGDVWQHRISFAEMVEHVSKNKGQIEVWHGHSLFRVNGFRAIYIEPSTVIGIITRLHKIPGFWMLYYVAYRLWQKRAFKAAKELLKESGFDVVHQLNMIGYREPGYMWKLGVPFFWGPVGGAPNEPLPYLRLFSLRGRFFVLIRTVLNEVEKRLNLRARAAARKARKVWAVTDADYRMIRELWGVECEKMVETGTVLRRERITRSWDGSSTLQMVWSGLHVPRKALPILLCALARVKAARRNLNVRVEVLGDGPETAAWKKLAIKMGVGDFLRWHGRLTHDKALAVMNSSHVLVFTSLKEGTPHVVLEALSLGLPVICHDACGMGTVVDETCGIKVPLKNPRLSVDEFARAIESILSKPHRVEELSKGAVRKSDGSTWEILARKISEEYENAQ